MHRDSSLSLFRRIGSSLIAFRKHSSSPAERGKACFRRRRNRDPLQVVVVLGEHRETSIRRHIPPAFTTAGVHRRIPFSHGFPVNEYAEAVSSRNRLCPRNVLAVGGELQPLHSWIGRNRNVFAVEKDARPILASRRGRRR